MGWDEWSARHVEREVVVPHVQRLRMKANPKAPEEVQVEMSSEVSGQKRNQREREEVQKCTKQATENQWYVFNHSETLYADLPAYWTSVANPKLFMLMWYQSVTSYLNLTHAI